jgi:hypothetical protein
MRNRYAGWRFAIDITPHPAWQRGSPVAVECGLAEIGRREK